MMATVKFRRESLSEIESEMRELVIEHWKEIVDDPNSMPLDVDWQRYRKSEAAGEILIVTARADGRLVGYVGHVMGRLPHYKWCLAAKDDAHFLLKEYRLGGVGARMILEAEKHLALLGVEMVFYHCKAREDLDRGPLFERMGYGLTERVYSKRL